MEMFPLFVPMTIQLRENIPIEQIVENILGSHCSGVLKVWTNVLEYFNSHVPDPLVACKLQSIPHTSMAAHKGKLILVRCALKCHRNCAQNLASSAMWLRAGWQTSANCGGLVNQSTAH